MSAPTLFLGGLLALATSAGLAFTSRLVWTRPVSPEARPALRLFALWWLGAALVAFVPALRTLLYLAGVQDLALHRALLVLEPLPLAAALWGLTSYVCYLYCGSLRPALPLGAGAFALFVLSLAYQVDAGPWFLDAEPWQVRLLPASVPNGTLTVALTYAVAFPILFCTIAYAALIFRLERPQQRFRVLIVATACLQWVTVLTLALLVGAADALWFPVFAQAPGLLAAGLVAVAYRPPGFLQSLLGDGAVGAG